MKKLAIIIAALLLSALSFALPHSAQATYYSTPGLPFYSMEKPPYSCASSVAGFTLAAGGQGIYRLTGPVYVPQPGYTYTITPPPFTPAPGYVEATLTLIPPSNTLGPEYLPRLTEVPSLWVDYSFVSAVPVYKLTINIANPVNRLDTQITCLRIGVTQ